MQKSTAHWPNVFVAAAVVVAITSGIAVLVIAATANLAVICLSTVGMVFLPLNVNERLPIDIHHLLDRRRYIQR